MTQEQLEKGQELSKKITDTEAQLELIKRSESIYELYLKSYPNNKGGAYKFQAKYVDFDVFKTLTIQAVQRELNELKSEFEKL